MQSDGMKLASQSVGVVAAAAAIVALLSGCQTTAPVAASGTFESVRPILERDCVHCHGDARLPHMVSFADTAALAKLRGPNLWIWPGHPEKSRLYRVITAPDTTPNAMPPTGHAIAPEESESIRAWIAAGAKLPPGEPVKLTPRGEGIRSR